MRAVLLAILAAVAPAMAARANDLAQPQGPVLLTVTGEIENANGPGTAQLDLAMLERLPQHAYTTSTIWTDGTDTFSGVLLIDVLALVGAEGREIELVALNDYVATLDIGDVTAEAPLLAYRMNGQVMSVRDKGPVWLMFPFDLDARYRTEETYTRAVWQLVRLKVQE